LENINFWISGAVERGRKQVNLTDLPLWSRMVHIILFFVLWRQIEQAVQKVKIHSKHIMKSKSLWIHLIFLELQRGDWSNINRNLWRSNSYSMQQHIKNMIQKEVVIIYIITHTSILFYLFIREVWYIWNHTPTY
jgi:hypothetical protein